MLMLLKEQKGYLTVELTIVFTTIFFSLLLIIFLGIALYQQVALQSSVQLVASQGATMYGSGSTQMVTALKPLSLFKHQNPYINFLNSSDNKAAAESAIQSAIASASKQNEIYKGSNNSVNATIVRKFVSQKVVVNATRDYTMPIASVAATFGLTSPLKVNVTAAAPVTNPVEVIRTTDICIDALLYFEVTEEAIRQLGEYKGKVIGFINGLDISESD